MGFFFPHFGDLMSASLESAVEMIAHSQISFQAKLSTEKSDKKRDPSVPLVDMFQLCLSQASTRCEI